MCFRYLFLPILVSFNWLQMQEDFFGLLREMLEVMPEVKELHPIPDANVPVMKFKFNGISIHLLYAKLSLWNIPPVSSCFCPCLLLCNLKFLSFSLLQISFSGI